MSAPIGPGDWVECVRARGHLGGFVRVGTIYQVSHWDEAEVLPCTECGDATPGFYLAGIDLPWSVGSFCHCCFRPIYRRDEGLIQRLLLPIPAEPDLVTA